MIETIPSWVYTVIPNALDLCRHDLDALDDAFLWSLTDQGEQWWNEVFMGYIDGNEQLDQMIQLYRSFNMPDTFIPNDHLNGKKSIVSMPIGVPFFITSGDHGYVITENNSYTIFVPFHDNSIVGSFLYSNKSNIAAIATLAMIIQCAPDYDGDVVDIEVPNVTMSTVMATTDDLFIDGESVYGKGYSG
ncbi:MAG: hypothetical protein WC284_18520 [Candidimonas sp.]